MRTRQTLTISLPPQMLKQIEQLRRAENRTSSELVREALRTYFSLNRFPVETPTKAELTAIRRGEKALARGEFVTLDELLHELDSLRYGARQKVAAQTSRKGSKTH